MFETILVLDHDASWNVFLHEYMNAFLKSKLYFLMFQIGFGGNFTFKTRVFLPISAPSFYTKW